MKRLLTLLFIVVGFSVHAQYFIYFDGTVNLNLLVIDTVNYHHNIWQIGKPSKDTFNSALSLPNALMTDTLHPYAANDTSVFILKVPTRGDTCNISHTPAPLISIELLYKMDIDSNATARIELSSDSGATWVDLDTTAYGLYWYDTSFDLTRSTHYWTNLRLELPLAAASDTLLYRFTFISDSNLANKEGWMIDNIRLWYWCEGAVPMTIQDNSLFSFYPNPSSGTIHVQAGKHKGPGTLAVYDVFGKEMFRKINVLSDDTLDLPLPEGIYVVKYHAGDAYAVRKLIITN